MVCFSSTKAGCVEVWDSWSKEVGCRGAELPEQPPIPASCREPCCVRFLVPDGEKRMSIVPRTVPWGHFALIIFVGWRRCLGGGPQEVANRNLGLPMGVGNCPNQPALPRCSSRG